MDDGQGAPILDPVEQRVLGALMEKEVTVPASYPMTLNALRTACNQSSSRDPVVDYDETTILDAIDRLRPRGLARIVHASHGARTAKYRHVVGEHLGLDPAEQALLTVLLLRGAQSAGELKTRTERLHPFADRSEVEAVLSTLAARSVPLVVERERRAGQHDTRWVHLLGPVPEGDGGGRAGGAAVASPGVDRDQVLAEGPAARDARVTTAYDAMADAYADALLDELDHKPFDRWLLERIAADSVAAGGPVVDAGCGPGHVAFHLAAAGADVVGVDLSPGMVDEAHRRFPDLTFRQGDLTDLPLPDDGSEGWAAIVAWYSLVHVAGSELAPALALMAQRLRPGGTLAVAVHVGEEVRHVTELFGRSVDVDFVLHDQAQVLGAATAVGLEGIEWYRRGPYPTEAQTERLYVIGRRPA